MSQQRGLEWREKEQKCAQQEVRSSRLFVRTSRCRRRRWQGARARGDVLARNGTCRVVGRTREQQQKWRRTRDAGPSERRRRRRRSRRRSALVDRLVHSDETLRVLIQCRASHTSMFGSILQLRLRQFTKLSFYFPSAKLVGSIVTRAACIKYVERRRSRHSTKQVFQLESPETKHKEGRGWVG